jgi:hypothetical protein
VPPEKARRAASKSQAAGAMVAPAWRCASVPFANETLCLAVAASVSVHLVRRRFLGVAAVIEWRHAYRKFPYSR